MEQTHRELPIFPLGEVVLFPGMLLPLQIFEERYKLMLSDIRENDSCFGVVLIRSGQEVGEPALPHSMGTVARIAELKPTEGERFLLTTVGEQRFRIQETLRERPYILARVELLASEAQFPAEEELVQQVRQAFEEYARLLMVLQGGWARRVETPSNPAELSYAVGQGLQAKPQVKQQLLEAPSPQERLKAELPLLQGASARLLERIQAGRSPSQFSQN